MWHSSWYCCRSLLTNWALNFSTSGMGGGKQQGTLSNITTLVGMSKFQKGLEGQTYSHKLQHKYHYCSFSQCLQKWNFKNSEQLYDTTVHCSLLLEFNIYWWKIDETSNKCNGNTYMYVPTFHTLHLISCRSVALRKIFCWQTGELQCHP